MQTESVIDPKDIVALLKGAAPERSEEITSLWARYAPQIVLATDAKRITLDANKDRIRFDAKSFTVFWLLGFAGWKAIECYSPLVLLSDASGQPITKIILDDPDLDRVERDYKERRATAQSLIDASDVTQVVWPDDIPLPHADRDAFTDNQGKAAFDLACLTVAFTLLHEFRHVMLDRDIARPTDVSEEEMACDVWAREFMTAKLQIYALEHGHDFAQVLRKRSMGLAIAALVIHEITPELEHGGSRCYFSTRLRLLAILENTKLPDSDHFWVLAASLLVGIYRQAHRALPSSAMSPKALALALVDQL